MQILALNMIVAVGEAVVTGFVVAYLSRFLPISSVSNCSGVVAICQGRERISTRRAAF
jgi:hypothetical protein